MSQAVDFIYPSKRVRNDSSDLYIYPAWQAGKEDVCGQANTPACPVPFNNTDPAFQATNAPLTDQPAGLSHARSRHGPPSEGSFTHATGADIRKVELAVAVAALAGMPLSTYDMTFSRRTVSLILIFTAVTIMAVAMMDNKDEQEPLIPADGVENPSQSIDAPALASIIEEYRPNLSPYERFYRDTHQDPEISGLESKTSDTVAQHLKQLGFEVHTKIGGHGVVGVLKNGPGKTVLIRAELDALPILEQTDVPYKSTKRMADRYGNERPVMHACGHDMNMATLLGASELLKRSTHKWTGTLVTLFQPDEEETGGAQAMVDDGLYNRVPLPDILLGQHVVPLLSGTVAIRPGPVLISADSVNVRVTGGPCESSLNPQLCVDPIPLAMRIITTLQERIPAAVAPEDASVACWGFHAGVPGNDYVAFADFLLDVKAWKPNVRKRVLDMVTEIIKAECKAAKTPKDPVIEISVRAPLTSNSDLVTATIQETFKSYFDSSLAEMQMTRACEDFSTLGATHEIPYAYWNFGGSSNVTGEIPTNHSPYFAPAIQPTLKVGTDAMALAALTFLVSESQEEKNGNRGTEQSIHSNL